MTAGQDDLPSTRRRSGRAAVMSAIVASTALLAACTSGGDPAGHTSGSLSTAEHTSSGTPSTSAVSSPAVSVSPTSVSPSPTPTRKPDKPVHISLLSSDGSHYGVGMPVIAYFSRTIKSAKALQAATTVTANGKALPAAWYFETSDAGHGPIEAHLRPRHYWPAHATIHVGIPAKGLTAGTGLAYDDSLTLDFSTGAKHVSVVDDRTHTMTVRSDGKKYGTFPVSLGYENTPTARGTKVIMEKGRDISMRGPGYYDPHVYDTQRLTYGGEYLHSAPWNTANIGHTDTSNGCTNLDPDDAQQLYHYLEVGDIVKYPNANGPHMTLGAGYGDWNLSWSTWLTGGLVSTS